jgi:2-phosphoglycerate kinase
MGTHHLISAGIEGHTMEATETRIGQLPLGLRVILVGGTSHVGKSMLARYMAEALGWEYGATDKLARHPGRPWRDDGTNLPQHVSEHFSKLTVDELLLDVLRHYERNVVPLVDALVRARESDRSSQGLMLEGSALWPTFVTPLLSSHAAAVWLTASDELLVQRIHASSRYEEKPLQERVPIQKFIERTLAFGRGIDKAVRDNALPTVRLRGSEAAGVVAERCLRAIKASVHRSNA